MVDTFVPVEVPRDLEEGRMMLPPSVTVIEVGPRDGFQMETAPIPADRKIEIVNRLVDAGLRHFEVTSFVSPRAIPQMADATEVVAGVKRVPGLFLTALVPTPRGAENAARAGVDAMVAFVSASESHNRANVNRSVAESLDGFREVAGIATAAGVGLRAAVPTAFGCPFEGDVPPEAVARIVEGVGGLGVASVTLGDTTGMATPPIVRRTCGYLSKRFPDTELSLHFHDTRGLGLVNAYEALGMGYTHFEASVAGLGGCPFAPGASGNVSTEDLVNLLHELGVGTGIDLEALIEAARRVEEIVGRPLPGQVMKAGPRLRLHPPPEGAAQRRLAEPRA
jgi:hydroxymethylglutaryl-CoA lyase